MSKGILEANKQLKQAFAACFGFGAICILVVSVSPNIPAFWLLILGIIPVFAYIGYGSNLSKKHKDNVGFSDSVYYLGFTLTLVSLFFAIINERVTSTASTEMTLQYFGFALATIILNSYIITYHLKNSPIFKLYNSGLILCTPIRNKQKLATLDPLPTPQTILFALNVSIK